MLRVPGRGGTLESILNFTQAPPVSAKSYGGLVFSSSGCPSTCSMIQSWPPSPLYSPTTRAKICVSSSEKKLGVVTTPSTTSQARSLVIARSLFTRGSVPSRVATYPTPWWANTVAVRTASWAASSASAMYTSSLSGSMLESM